MANEAQLQRLLTSVEDWNDWRAANPDEKIDLMGADLYQKDLSGAALEGADVRRMNLREVNLSSANLSGADLYRSNMNGVNLQNANLTDANLQRVYLGRANLCGADFSSANLKMSLLSQTDIQDANFNGARVYGISTWNLKGVPLNQSGLIITETDAPEVTVDDIKMAQFIYLLLANQELRSVIQTVTSKAVLILGRFYKERKQILDALRDELKQNDLAPIVFDFEPSENRDLTETVQLLANMSKFVIADITDAKSIPQELNAIIPNFPSVPVRPIILEAEKAYAMFKDFEKRPSVILPIFEYKDRAHLLANLESAILDPVDSWKQELDGESDAIRKLKEQKNIFDKLKVSDPEEYERLRKMGIISD